eukprot:5559698-Amphidinium_carterae.1
MLISPTVLDSLLAFAKDKAGKGDQAVKMLLESKELEEELASAYLQDAPASDTSAADMGGRAHGVRCSSSRCASLSKAKAKTEPPATASQT